MDQYIVHRTSPALSNSFWVLTVREQKRYQSLLGYSDRLQWIMFGLTDSHKCVCLTSNVLYLSTMSVCLMLWSNKMFSWDTLYFSCLSLCTWRLSVQPLNYAKRWYISSWIDSTANIISSSIKSMLMCMVILKINKQTLTGISRLTTVH